MKEISIVVAVILFGTVGAYAAEKSNGSGASEYTPGDTMKDKGGKGGASNYTPGHEQKKPGGASELSPGDRRNDRR
jgi:hypothetical protein